MNVVDSIVLSSITDAMVDAAAREMWNDRDARVGGAWDDRRSDEVCVVQTRATARAAIVAALRVLMEQTAPATSAPAPVSSRKTMTVPEAGEKYFGLQRDASYAAAARGDIPTMKIGRTLRVPIAAMEKKLHGKETVIEAKP